MVCIECRKEIKKNYVNFTPTPQEWDSGMFGVDGDGFFIYEDVER
jgi:hypothetical protein